MSPEDFDRLRKQRTIADEIERRLRYDYSHALIDDYGKFVDSLQKMLNNFNSVRGTVQGLLKDACWIIYRLFDIKEVAIGLKSKNDGLFRYEIFIGYRKDAEEAHRNLTYTNDDFFNLDLYHGRKISENTLIFLAEDQPFVEEEALTYNRPVMLTRIERKSPEESLQADYLNILIFDRRKQLIGWIETSGTKKGKIPDVRIIKLIELTGSIIGVALKSEITLRKR